MRFRPSQGLLGDRRDAAAWHGLAGGRFCRILFAAAATDALPSTGMERPGDRRDSDAAAACGTAAMSGTAAFAALQNPFRRELYLNLAWTPPESSQRDSRCVAPGPPGSGPGSESVPGGTGLVPVRARSRRSTPPGRRPARPPASRPGRRSCRWRPAAGSAPAGRRGRAW